MHYVIDGHNLIGQLPGIRLSDPDDELKLVDLLHRFVLRHPQHQVTVVFDGGTYGHPISLRRERVTPIFARSPSDADARIIKLLRQVADPTSYMLVTNDRAIRSVAATIPVATITSTEFATDVLFERRPKLRRPPHRPTQEPLLSASEVEEWLRLFGER